MAKTNNSASGRTLHPQWEDCKGTRMFHSANRRSEEWGTIIQSLTPPEEMVHFFINV